MGRRDHDEESVVTVNFDDDVPRSKSGKPLSDKKLRQLAAARDKALLTRRKKLKDKLEAKLSEFVEPEMRPAEGTAEFFVTHYRMTWVTGKQAQIWNQTRAQSVGTTAYSYRRPGF